MHIVRRCLCCKPLAWGASSAIVAEPSNFYISPILGWYCRNLVTLFSSEKTRVSVEKISTMRVAILTNIPMGTRDVANTLNQRHDATSILGCELVYENWFNVEIATFLQRRQSTSQRRRRRRAIRRGFNVFFSISLPPTLPLKAGPLKPAGVSCNLPSGSDRAWASETFHAFRSQNNACCSADFWRNF